MVVSASRLDQVANVVMGIATKAGGVVEIFPLQKQVGHLNSFTRDLPVDLGEVVARAACFRDFLRVPECSGV
ncbi:hypothetical protein ACFDR9_001417 [Janthinobacterium sp. CG_23.3]|uniref:hypothetical protein n=1 Tax=unclassified Janthinobacterium TaxID=2610881 RepID=UPI0012F9CCF0|nr:MULTISPECIES: hypothetical protein [unclassified Janthinobacterium]MEC5160047.1 hypothetical protein [Janthinobacterium sp. CG_S6]